MKVNFKVRTVKIPRSRSVCHHIAIVGIAVLPGCTKQALSPEAAPKSEATAPAGADSATTDANQFAATTLAELTQTVRKYAAEKQRVPKDLNELVTGGYLPSIP